MTATAPDLGHVSAGSVRQVQHASPVEPAGADLEARYERLVLDRIDERFLVINHSVGHRSQGIAEKVAEFAGTPHDVIEVHVAVLRRVTIDVSSSRATALLDAGEDVLLLTLGHLADHYRSLALDAATA